MTTDRCEYSDLPREMCAHCQTGRHAHVFARGDAFRGTMEENATTVIPSRNGTIQEDCK